MFKYIAILLLAALVFLLFSYKLTDVPPGINGDEAAIGINAAYLSKTGYDSENRFLPLFTNTKNSPDWKQPVSVYATTLVFKLFGISYFNLRFVSVVFIFSSALAIYFLIKELIGKNIAMAGVIVFLTTPVVMIQSHLALENIAPVPFVSLWLLMLIKYTKKQNDRLLFFAGALLGISIFSYLGMRMIAPVLGILTTIYIYYLNRGKEHPLKEIKWFLLGCLPFVSVLILSKLLYPGVILGQFRPYKIEDYQAVILPYLSAFDPSFLFLKGDVTPYHSTGRQGMFLLASLPLFIAGLVGIIRSKKPILVFILIAFFSMPLLFGLGSTIHRASRILSMIPMYIVIASYGVQMILGIKKKIIGKILLILTVLFIGLNFYDFLSDYWYKYPQRVKADFAKPIHTLYDQLKTKAKNENLKPYVDDYPFTAFPDAQSFFKLVYSSKGIPVWSREQKIPPRSIVLTDITDVLSKEKLEIVKAGELDYYFIINRTDNEI